ncbi:glycoside hydrolase family 43 protein [Galbibacter pacificus]|uniref:Glycoside hydrolase family 43 protein n=1 Tax=Galbibacter pacificus TaxID=2996052 RepID=A0ABT6FPN7_9FLAO|nr:glycoside hydrolase family 43 protein [Galbibacter pacificus]MDG3582306.1 glycoside hydrolase family 43 protein [Galbibacter pacificus]MDG3585218.1 glycoside hydrolase family 43 protein [Galbibacter pacificus]
MFSLKKQNGYRLWVFVSFIMIFFQSCNTGSKSNEKEIGTIPFKKSTAYFDDFKYTGKDDFYNENTLPDNSYFYNPILPGWYSDPSICSNGEDYFLVTSTFSYYPGVPIFHSKDLVNWKQIGHVLDRPEQLPLDGQRITEGIFAPAISYNPHNKTYYMITTNIKKGNFFVKTKDPFKGWSDPVWLPEVQGIDPSFFFDDDGKAYVVNNDAPDGGSQYEGHRAIRIQEFDVKTETMKGPRKMIVNGGVDLSEKPIWIEGPHVYKINGSYYLMCAEGGTSVNHREVIFKSESVLGPYKPWNKNPILTQKHLDPNRPLPITCAGHADLIQKKDSSWWAVFLACRPIDNDFENLGRETFLMPVQWDESGFPYMTRENETIPRIIKMPGSIRAKKTTYGNFSITDDFTDSLLPKEWVTIRGDGKNLYSLKDIPGYLALSCADVNTVELKTPAFVSRRLQHHKFEAETTVYFEPSGLHEAAGILLMKDETHQYAFTLTGNEKSPKILVEKITKDGREILTEKNLETGEKLFHLKVISNGLNFEFQYASNTSEWKTLKTGVDARYLSTANSYGFTGTNIGVYATKKRVPLLSK